MYNLITSVQEAGAMLTDLQSVDRIGLDTETTTLDPYSAKVLLIQLNLNNKIYLLDVRRLGNFITYIISVIKDSNKLIVGHNLKFDIKMIYHTTHELLINCWDTMIAEMLINSGLMSKYPSLKELIYKYMYVTIDKETRDSFINYNGELTNDQLIYSTLDVKYLFDIQDKQREVLESQGQMKVALLENSIVALFSKMEYDGIKLDKSKWLANTKLENENARFREKALIDYILDNIDYTKYSNAGELISILRIPVKTKKDQVIVDNLKPEFIKEWLRENLNINSTYQIRGALSLLGVDVPDTNEDTLKKYTQYDIIKLILDYRESGKRVSTYGESHLENINPYTGYIHTEWNQLVSTGRTSSRSPNLQNQPREQNFRECYVAREGKLLLTADYSQAELRLVGAVCGEPTFIEAFKHNEDLHRKTAALLYNIPIEDVTKDQRYRGKTLNFSIIYGISKYGLYRKNNIPLEEGEKLLDTYFEKLPYIKAFIEAAGNLTWKRKYSTTPYGRRRFFEDKKIFPTSADEYRYISSVKREGPNHVIQGGIADAIKIAMKDIFYNNPFGEGLKILLQVHDELVIEIDSSIRDDAIIFVNDCMVKALQPFLGEIPAIVDIHVADCWTKD